ncbi:MAG: short-chainputative dehydrogenase [Bacteroidota bacterium]|jgi:short-subunit dehydrogenase|nr:short-chainputative dehydrogenase [Bacteroidota bacterium]
MELQKKIVWITGASSGIGEALAYNAANEGAKIVISARRENELKRVAAACKTDPSNVFVLPLDLENTTNVEEKVNQVIQKFGRIDVLINNSGMGHRTKAVNTSTEIDRKVMEVNFFGTINLTKAVAKKMQAQKSGKIVVISSIMGKYGLPLYSTYAASKFALYGYFESLRQELYKDNVRVLIVSPGFINTDVSTKLLMENGKEYGIKSESQNKGMSPDNCAKGIIKAIKGNRDHKFVGGYEIFSVYVKQYFPRIFYKLMRKMTKE